MRSGLFLFGIVFSVGCGSGSGGGAPLQLPEIVTQPVSETVPAGLAASFKVVAWGSPVLSYQWQEAGVDIPGATASNYTIQSTSLTDSGDTFDVLVTNSVGSVRSSVAVLTIGARSPAPGDWRFQQVDAATTINGYTGLLTINLPGSGGLSYADAFGIPLSVGPSCNPSYPSSFDCGWLVDVFTLPAGAPALAVFYQSYAYSDLQSTLSTLADPSIVITGMDLEPANSAMAFSWIKQPSGLGFDGVLHTVPQAAASNAIASEAILGRVVTAISYNNGQISFMSYGWQGNGSVIYDTAFESSSITNAANVASTMAANGYILTGIGGNELSGVLLVGTRVHGDSLQRPIMIIPGGHSPYPLAAQGYATVAVLYSTATGFVDYVGER